jgi:hypothetical protein
MIIPDQEQINDDYYRIDRKPIVKEIEAIGISFNYILTTNVCGCLPAKNSDNINLIPTNSIVLGLGNITWEIILSKLKEKENLVILVNNSKELAVYDNGFSRDTIYWKHQGTGMSMIRIGSDMNSIHEWCIELQKQNEIKIEDTTC